MLFTNRTNRICLLKRQIKKSSSNVFYLYFLFLRLCMCSWFYNKTHHLLNWGHDTSQGRITQNNTAYDSCTEREQELLERIPAYDKGVNLSDRQTVILFFFFCSFPEEQHAFNLFCQWPCKTNAKSTYTNKPTNILLFKKKKHIHTHKDRADALPSMSICVVLTQSWK